MATIARRRRPNVAPPAPTDEEKYVIQDPEIKALVEYVLKTPNSKLELPNDKLVILQNYNFPVTIKKFIFDKLNVPVFELQLLNRKLLPLWIFDLSIYSFDITFDKIKTAQQYDWYYANPNIHNIFINSDKKIKSINHALLYILVDVSLGLDTNNFSEYNDLCLILAYHKRNLGNVNFLLERKFFPTKFCLDVLVESVIEKRYFDQKWIDIFKTFGNYGYKFTYDDFIRLVSSTIYIDPSDYDIQMDCNFYNKCIQYAHIENGYKDQSKQYITYITNQFTKVAPDITVLEVACQYLETPLVKILINKYKIKPNEKCLELACSSTKSFAVLKLLFDSGLNPNKQCVLNMLNAFDNKPANLLAEKYKTID
jgi:hypothetical protein